MHSIIGQFPGGLLTQILDSPESYKARFQWLQAANAYKTILDSKGADDRAELLERIGSCFFHAAMQANSNSMFQNRIRRALAQYGRASTRATNNTARIFRCRAWQDFLKFWLARNAVLKKRSLEKAFTLVEKALALSHERRDGVCYVRTFDELCFVYSLGFDYETAGDKRARKLQKGIDHCRRIIGLLEENRDREVLSRTLARFALFIDQQGDETFDLEKRDRLDSEGLEAWRRAVKIDRNAALLAVGYPPAGFFRLLDEEECKQVCIDALNIAEKAKDNFSIGWQLDQMAGREYMRATWGLEPREQLMVAHQGIMFSEKAERKHLLTNFVTPNNGMVWSGAPHAEWFLGFSKIVSDTAQKLLYLEKAWRETNQLLRLANASGFPRVMMYAHHVMSCILQDRAEVETDVTSKKRSLRGALYHRLIFLRINEKIHPDDAWSNATALRYTSRNRSKLAEFEPRKELRVALLKAAARDKKLASEFAVSYAKNVSRGQDNSIHDQVGNIFLELGKILDSLFVYTGEETFLQESAEACLSGAEWYADSADYRTFGIASWRAAHAFDRLQAFTLAAENFEIASKAYLTLSEKQPTFLANLHREYSRYLEAWNKIELARIAHRRLDFDAARKLYESVASLHHTTNRWKFLTTYYQALAKLEQAEEESKQGLHPQSVSTLKEAAELFRQSNIALQRHSVQLERTLEKSMVDSLAVGSKDDYCIARIQLEEARINETQGDHHSAAEKYRRVADRFLEIAKASSKPYERKEMLFLSNLSRGLQSVAESIITDHAASLKGASKHFERSMKQAADENWKSLASGYKYLCLATISCNQYMETFDRPHYDEASRYLDLASNNFANSGFPSASAQVQSYKLLIDAQSRIRENGNEQDAQKRSVSLEIARSMIRQAAETLAKNHQGVKAQKFYRLATSLNEQVELSNRVAEVSQFASHNITTTFVFPGSLGADVAAAIGHARLAEAGVEASYDVRRTSEHQISVRLQIVNTGDQPIKLLRIENIAPEKSSLFETPEGSSIDGQSLVLRSKTLGQLALETVTIGLRTNRRQKIAVLRPRIVFHGNNGQELFTNLPVKILGPSPIMDFVTREFFDDYNKKRLSLEHAGWRSMTAVAETMKIPRSQLYGERRLGRSYGYQLETLIKSGLVELRIFPGERGRGGRITKIRLAFDNKFVQEYVKTVENPRDFSLT